MAITIKNYKDLESFVRTMAKSDISELDDIGRLQFDFMYSMPQKISAAKNTLRPAATDDMSEASRHAKGRLRLIEEAESVFNSSYDKYAENAVDYYIATKGLSILEQARGSGAVQISDTVLEKLRQDCGVIESRNKNYRKDIVTAFGILEAMIDGKGMDRAAARNYQKYGVLGKNQNITHSVQDSVTTAHYSMLREIGLALGAQEQALMFEGKPLAAGDWRESLMNGCEPLRLTPEKAVLCLDKTEMNGEKLSINNYKKLLKSNPAAANAWAQQCFDNMFGGMYNASELNEMEQDGASALDGVYLDGRPLSEFFPDARREDLCRLTADALLNGGHVLTVCKMEKQGDSYNQGEPLRTEVETKLPEKVSLWHRFLRKLGIEKTQKEKMAVSELEVEASVERINATRLNDKLEARIEEYTPAVINNERVCFEENALGDTGRLGAYKGTDGSQKSVLTTMDRAFTRGNLATLYLLGSGMSVEEVMSAAPALDERKKALGKEFLDTLTIHDRDKFAAEKGLDTKAEGFESAYLGYCADKERAIVDTYNNVLYNGLCKAEQSLAGLDINDSRQLIEKYPAAELCVMGALDYEQSIAHYERAHPEDAVTKQKRDYANAMKGYGVVAAYCEAKANAFSPNGIARADRAVHALMFKAGAERVMNSLSGKTLSESSVTIAQMNEFKGMNDAIRLSGKQHIFSIDSEKLADMHGGALDALKSKSPVPPLFAKFIDNTLNAKMRREAIIPLPVSHDKFAAQFGKTAEKDAPSLSMNNN